MTNRNPHTADVPECSTCGAGIFAGQDQCAGCEAANPWNAPAGDPDDAAAVWFERGEYDARTRADLQSAGGYPEPPAEHADDYREGWEAGERYACEPYATSPAPASAPFPIFARQDAIEEDGALTLAHLLAVGVSFNARQKVNASETYSLRHAGSTLAIPSKLAQVGVFQDDVEKLEAATVGTKFYPTTLYRCESLSGTPEIIVLARTTADDGATIRAVGYLQEKHARWIAPLLDGTVPVGGASGADCPVRVYVTAVTGGTPDRPTRGVNVAICGVPDAIRRAYDAAAVEAQREAAYGSGNPVAIEATTV